MHRLILVRVGLWTTSYGLTIQVDHCVVDSKLMWLRLPAPPSLRIELNCSELGQGGGDGWY
ncbi:hypothetical protein M758_1G260600 [Ceratodon purpureus]|nr:hypothetical protein M758_1G260600 [Ceratodon purpureus]